MRAEGAAGSGVVPGAGAALADDRRDAAYDARSPPQRASAMWEEASKIQQAMLQASLGSSTSDLMRRAKRLYMGGLPQPTSDAELKQFIQDAVVKVYQPGDHVASAYVHPDKQFSFVEFRELAGAWRLV